VSIDARTIGHGREAGRLALARRGAALVGAVGKLVNRAVDEILLSDKRVVSAAEGRRLLAGAEQTEAFASDIQRVIVLALPVVRRLGRGARIMKVPWVMIGSTAVSMGVALRNGVREIQVLSSLVAHRLEQATGSPGDPALVEKLAIELYLHPKRRPELGDDKLHLARLTRKWLLSGMFGRKTEKRAARALDAAERFDPVAVSQRWNELRRR
jgi:hypothetical protein